MGHHNGRYDGLDLLQSFAGGGHAQRCVLVIDADPAFRHVVAELARRAGFAARTGSGAADLARQLASGGVDLVVAEARLGADDGLHLLRQVRACSDIPVVVVTDGGEDAVDRIVVFELGADDHLAKPLSPHELLARVRAVLRRTGAPGRRPGEIRESRFAGWHLDRQSRRLTDPDGTAVALTKSEHALLLAFLDAPGRPLSRPHLLAATRMDEDVFDRSMDVQVLRLRRKLARGRNGPALIETVRGIGYPLNAQVQNTPPG